MGGTNFLNIEYLLLRVGDILTNLRNTFLGAPATDTSAGSGILGQNASQLSDSLTFTGQQLALLGMAASIILLALCLWIRIKLEVYEHEEFHKRDAKYGGHGAHGEHENPAHIDMNAPLILGAEQAFTAHKPQKDTSRWQRVVTLSYSQNEGDWRRAIIEADIMLGEMLEAQGYRGSTIGDQLKDANPLQFQTLDLAWQAHKLRNDIAHGGEQFHLSERDVRTAIDQYKRVFEEYDFI